LSNYLTIIQIVSIYKWSMRVYSKLAGRKGAVYVPFVTFFRNKKMLVYNEQKSMLAGANFFTD
jgi:hypothetical protein